MSAAAEPVLSPEKWEVLRSTQKVALGLSVNRLVPRVETRDGRIRIVDGASDAAFADPAPVLAVSNDLLAADDPRKITREKLGELRILIKMVENDRGSKQDEASAFVDALASYLPPIGM